MDLRTRSGAHRVNTRLCVAALVLLALPGCATVRRVLGLDDPPKGVTTSAPVAAPSAVPPRPGKPVAEKPPVVRPPVPARDDPPTRAAGPMSTASAEAQAAKTAAIRAEIHVIEAELKSGKLGLRDAEKRLRPMRKDLEDLIRDAARDGGKANSLLGADLRARVEAAEQRLFALEEQFQGVEAKLLEALRRLDEK